jgi:predicted MFS family arabinose efflux permease
MKKYYTITVLFLLQMLAYFEMSGLISASGYIIKTFGVESNKVMYLSIGAYIVGFFAPFIGGFADKHGKKITLLISTGLFIIGSFSIVISNNFLLFIVSRIAIGFLVINGNAIILSYVGDIISYKSRGKFFGIIRISVASGIALSPLYTSRVILNYGIAMLYKLYIIYAAILFIALLFIPEIKAQGNSEKIKIKDIMAILKDEVARNFVMIQSILAFSSIVIFGYLGIHILNVLDGTILQVGYAFTVGGMGTFLASFASTILLDKMNRIKYTKFVFFATAVAVLPLPFVKIPILYIFMFLFSLGFDSSWPAFQLLSSEIVPQRKSTYMSILGGVMAITNIFASLVGQYMYSFGGLKIMSITVSMLFIVAIAIFSITTKKHENRFN